MKYQVIYKVIRDEKGEIVDLFNEWECRTQNEVAKWLKCNQWDVSRASIKTFTPKHIKECTPINLYGNEYVIIKSA